MDIVLGVLGSGLILWQVAAVGATATFAGSFMGGRMAVYKGNAFIMRVTIVLIFLSAMALLAEALQ